tara:strand:+ start:1705 stop:2325 length:621 start_codon:yes stop_codon:yes gene_type:complete
MRVLVFGDSQSQSIGKALGALLQQRGHVVQYLHKPGRSTAKLLTEARSKIDPASYDAIYVFSGGNDPSPDTGPTSALLDYLRPAKRVVWIGPPPATRITNLPLARKVFGGKVKTPTYWYDSGTATKREAKNTAFKAVVQGSHAVYYDVRTAFGPFPPQADGIHVRGDTADHIAHNLADKLTPRNSNTWGWAAAAVVGVLLWRRQNT